MRLGTDNLKNWDGRWLGARTFISDRNLLRMLYRVIRRKRIPYPLLMSYSDFLVVPAVVIREFCRLCGVTAAMGLFVEIAIPTALALVCPVVVTEDCRYARNSAQDKALSTRRIGKEIWTPQEVDAFRYKFDGSLKRLEQEFPEDLLYVHPVKLSKWRVEGE